ncbi:hypothetical protein C8J57DRAFT_1515182 [Mycena rebaudengoi]|nr:hypothetical protein C8J57DRAFT_1515182 [Mycena rebaudengoi]
MSEQPPVSSGVPQPPGHPGPIDGPGALPGPYTGGDLTFYTPSTMNYTACGPKRYDTDPIAALPGAFFNSTPGATPDNPNNSPLCGKEILITAIAPDGQTKTIQATISDICGDCPISTSVDVTPILFDQVADQSVGRLHNISWDFVTVAKRAARRPSRRLP